LKSAARLVEQATANKAQHAKAVEEANTLPPEQTKVCKTTSTTGSLTCGARLPLTAFTKRRSVCKYCTTRTREAKAVAKLDKKGKADEQEEQRGFNRTISVQVCPEYTVYVCTVHLYT